MLKTHIYLADNVETFVHFQQKRQSIFMAYKLKQRKLTLNVTIGVFDNDVIF